MKTNNLRKWLAAGVILLVLLAVNAGIWQKEQILKQGDELRLFFGSNQDQNTIFLIL